MNQENNNLQNTSPNTQQKQKKKRKTSGLGIFIIILIIIIGFASYSIFFENNTNNKNSLQTTNSNFSNNNKPFFSISTKTKKNIHQTSSSYIAKIYITGVIQNNNKTYDQQWLLDTIKTLKDDKHNKGIMLYINSPGGSVYESDEVYQALNDYQKSRKPVWAYMGPLAASGGYYISCSAEYICANRNTLTGSIGVISGESLDLTKMMENLGIKSRTFTAGKNKNMLNYNEPLSEQQEQIMQSIADECYDQFTSIVAINRKIDIDKVKEIADGRIYTANQALKLNLIDKICNEDEAISSMKAKYQFNDTDVIDYCYTPTLNWMDYFYSAIKELNPISQTAEAKVLDMIDNNLTYPAYIYK